MYNQNNILRQETYLTDNNTLTENELDISDPGDKG